MDRTSLCRSGVIFFLSLLLLVVAGTTIFPRPCFGQEESKEKQAPTSTRAKNIFNRSKILAANIIAASKSVKGVGQPISNRAAWEIIAQSPAFRNVIAEAEKFQKEPIPFPDEEDYMRFYEQQTGKYVDVNRDYENKYNIRRNRLFRLVLAECFENKGRFLPDIEEIIMIICTEPAWTIPWDDGEAKKFKGESKAIDHQVARTAWNLATADYWLGRKLSASTRDLIRDMIQDRIFSVFEDAILTDNYGQISWANAAGPWNANCHAAVVGTALALIEPVERRALYVAAAETNVEKFLQIFTRDGYYVDGIWSWNEGYGPFILLAEIMYQSTGGRIDMFKRPNIKETALYGPRMEITPGVYESFGNHWRGDRPITFPTAFISKRFRMGLTEIENRAPFFGVGPGHLYMVGIYCFPNSATEEKGEPGATVIPPVETLRSEFPLNGVMILRSGKKDSRQMGVQLKGGSNDERANHSDVGTYVVALGGGRPLTDIGARYNRRGLVIKDIMESNLVNSFGHPVPRIDEKLQKNGKGTVTPLLDRNYTDEVDTLKFDLSYVYEWEDVKHLKELSRTFIFDRTGKDPKAPGLSTLTVVDRFRNIKPHTFENCLITLGPFKKLTEDDEATSIELIVGEGRNAIHVTVSNEVVELSPDTGKYVKQPKPMVFEAALLEEPIPRESKSPLRLSFGFESQIDEVTMTTKIRPADNSEQNLAKSSPGQASRVYTSPIDEQELELADLRGSATGSGDADALNAQFAKALEHVKKTFPATALERIKNASDEDIKTQLPMLKLTVPALKNVPEEQLPALIQYIKDNL